MPLSQVGGGGGLGVLGKRGLMGGPLLQRDLGEPLTATRKDRYRILRYLVARAIRNAIRANRFARIIRN